jgi:hypothetical protein
MVPQDGYPVVSVSHSTSGDRFVVGLGSAQPRVYDREGVELLKFVKGDMYIRDLSNTKVSDSDSDRQPFRILLSFLVTEICCIYGKFI